MPSIALTTTLDLAALRGRLQSMTDRDLERFGRAAAVCWDDIMPRSRDDAEISNTVN